MTTSTSNQPISPTLERATDYFKRGFAIIPVAVNEKKPIVKNWIDLRLSETDLPRHFSKPCNIGIVLGTASGGIVDIDIDSHAALPLASELLPNTDMIFGRAGRPASHYIYRLTEKLRREQFNTPDGSVIVEIRGDGHHTVFPGSVHETGEPVEFVKDGDPAEVTLMELITAAAKIAIATILLPHWQAGRRHDLALTLAGVLANSGFSIDHAKHLVSVTVSHAGDNDLQDRINCVIDAYSVDADRRPTLKRLCQIIGSDAAKRLQELATQSTGLSPSIVPSIASEPECSDVWATMAFAKEYDGELLYCEEYDDWYRRIKKIYRPIGAVQMQGVVMDFMRRLAKTLPPRMTKPLECRGRISAVSDLARSQLRVDRDVLDSNRQLLGCSDGQILSLETGKLVRSTKALVTKRAGTIFDEQADCPIWKEFLERIFAKDADVIEFVQRAVGYTLTGDVDEQCLFVLIGTGANGKSTFMSVLANLFGDYGGTTPMQCLMVQRSEQTNDLAALVGKRFVAASEGENGQKLAESKIKQMTGGDPITCRRLYHEFFTYQPQFKLWLATNNLPKINGTDDGIWRRIQVVPFPVTIPKDERDAKLSSKLTAELPGILNWALEGLSQWKAMGLRPPARVLEATGEYRMESDTVEQFITNCCMLDPVAKSSTKDLFEAYVRWCEQSGCEGIPKIMFGKALARKGFSPSRSGAGNGWLGLALIV